MRARLPLLTLAALLGACGGNDPVGPSGGGGQDVGTGALGGVTLSSPIPGSGAAEAVVYVGAVPGARPRARRVLLRNPRTGETREVAARDGGFDPVPIGAVEGDRISVEVEDSAGGRTTSDAPVRRPSPRLVRTSPRGGRTDVPLNVRIEVVFSAPMDARSLEQGLTLWSQGGPVAVEVVRASNGLSVAVVPTAPLLAGAEHEVRVAPDVRDVLGQPLDRGEVVVFRTAPAARPSLASVTVLPARHHVPGWDNPDAAGLWQPRALFVGDTFWLAASGRSGTGTYPRPVAATWTSSAPSVLRLEVAADEERAFAVAMSPGAAVVSAAAGGAVGAWSTQVYERFPAAELAGRWLYVARDAGVYRQRADGAEVQWLAWVPVGRADWAPFVHSFPFWHDWRVAGAHPTGGVAAQVDGGIGVERFGMWAGWVILSFGTHCPTWSPDGSRLLTTAQEAIWPGGDVIRVLHEGGALQTLGWQGGSVIGCPVWHPSQSYVVVSHGEGTHGSGVVSSWMVGLDPGSSPLRLFTGLMAGPYAPDGTSLLVVDQVGDLHVADASGALLRRIAGVSRIPPVAWSSDGALVAMPFYVISADGRYAANVNGEILGFAP